MNNKNKMTILDVVLARLKDISDFIIKLDNKIGFRKIVKYTVLILIVIGIINFKPLVKDLVELVQGIQNEIHDEKMLDRDELLKELNPLLQEFRVETGADRILYFEYHNSKENLVGIPFKYADMVIQNTSFGISNVPEGKYSDINTGSITNLYEDIKTGEVAYCSGITDTSFHVEYPGVYDLFVGNDDGTKQLVFISIPGISQPIGFIVLEWLDDKDPISLTDIKKVAFTDQCISRINALIMSKSN